MTRALFLLALLATAAAARGGCEDRVAALGATARERLPGSAFAVRPAAPFVLAVESGAALADPHIVERSAAALEEALFRRRPDCVAVWLFRDTASYAGGMQALFAVRPRSPYGHHLGSERAIAVNLEGGEGTIGHEIVHAYVAADCPRCPPWLDEGLASLHESAALRDGRVHGRTNWRLPPLQDAIRRDAVPTLERFVSLGPETFHDDPHGLLAAQARYLVYLLQERGRLGRAYRGIRDGGAADPTGAHTLAAALDVPDLAAAEEPWRRFVLGLRYPERAGAADAERRFPAISAPGAR